MTYKERLQKEHPEFIDERYRGGCLGCPETHGYESYEGCHAVVNGRDEITAEDCEDCWNREAATPAVYIAGPITGVKDYREKFAKAEVATPAVYIAGPITGVKDYREKFAKAEVELMKNGYIPLNPARNPAGLTNEQYMLMNVTAISTASAVYFLPGWQQSEGAQLEMQYALYIKKPVATSIEVLRKVLDNG